MMSTMNLALIAVMAAFLVLLLVMRSKTGAGATPKSKSAKAPKAQKVKAVKAPKAAKESRKRGRTERPQRGWKGRKRGRGADAPPAPPEPMPLGATTGAAAMAAEPVTGEFDIPTGPVAGEPDWDAMRSAMTGTAATVEPMEAPAQAEPAEWDDEELITEPGWPMPGDMDGGGWEGAGEPDTIGGIAEEPALQAEPTGDGWLGGVQAAPEAPAPQAEAAAEAEIDATWVDEPVTSWEAPQAEVDTPTIGGWDVPEAPAAEESSPWVEAEAVSAIGQEWTEDTSATAWGVEETPAAADASWEAPAEEPAGAWLGAQETVEEASPWAVAPEAPEAPEVEEPEFVEPLVADSLAAEEPVAVAPESDPVAEAFDWGSTPVGAGEWDLNGDLSFEPEAELVGASAEAAATVTPEAPVAEELDTPDWSSFAPVLEPLAEEAPAAPAIDEDWLAVTQATQVSEAPVEEPAVTEVEVPADAPQAAAEPEVDEIPVAEWVAEPVAVEVPEAPEVPAFEVPEAPEVPVAEVAPQVPVFEFADVPAAEAEVADAPVAPVFPVFEDLEEIPVPVTEGPAWWDEVDNDHEIVLDTLPDWLLAPADERFTGRWSLGGMALQPGHEALAGVSFRQALLDPPSNWSLPTRGRPAPGTLVLIVEALMNCEADGLEVLAEEGFAPGPEGFTLKLAAGSTGPFAASGTFRIVNE